MIFSGFERLVAYASSTNYALILQLLGALDAVYLGEISLHELRRAPSVAPVVSVVYDEIISAIDDAYDCVSIVESCFERNVVPNLNHSARPECLLLEELPEMRERRYYCQFSDLFPVV